jgi:GWxTD domain-containing protein
MQQQFRSGRPFSWMLLALAVWAMPALAGTTSPLQGVGEVPFSADMPVFFGPDGQPRVHVAARVFERDLTRPRAGEPVSLALRVKLARAGVVALDTTQTIQFTPRELDPALEHSWTEAFRLIEIAAPIGPGTWAVTLDLSDANGASSRAIAVLDVPSGDLPRLSDPQYQLDTAAGKLPWPDRVYGLNQDTLEVYFEVEVDEAMGAQPFRFQVHDPRYGLLDEQQLLLPLEPGMNAALWKMPVGDFPEGSYALHVVPPWDEDRPRLSEFSVSWRIDRQLVGGDELLVEARLALLPDDFDYFSRLSRARQIQVLDDFWRDVDPTPGTERNEIRDEFRARIAEANRIYHSRRGPGALSDQGRILVRFGQPEEIEVEVMPRDGDDLELAIQNLHDIYTPEVEGVMARGDIYTGSGTGPNVQPRRMKLPGVEDPESVDFSSDTATDLRRNAARVGREGAFEVWKYRYVGRPLLEHHRPGISENQHIRFIFVDRHGVGDYRLEFSNLSTMR